MAREERAILRRERIGYGPNPDRTYPVLRCGCGSVVHCTDGWANECEQCGAEYNGSGQRLADRRYWGEETGETF